MSNLANSLSRRVKHQLVNILDFAEAKWGPQIILSPAQRFAVKLGYKIPLDNKDKTIRVWDKFKENLLYTLTECEFRKYLYEEAGRINLPYDDSHITGDFNIFIRCFGRRAGKSEITALDLAYSIYTLLEKYDPHEYYHMPPNTEIFLPVLGTSQDSAKRTFRKVRNMLSNSPYFSNYCDKDDLQEIFCKVYTPAQREAKSQFPSIIVQAFPLSESQVRGPASYCSVCDEIAHWPHRGAVSDLEVLKAIQPSLSTFKPTEEERSDGKIFLISNAGIRDGAFFDLFKKSMEGSISNVISYQASTQELNPTRISSNELRDYYNQFGDVAYRTEHLSEFVDSISQWLSEDELNAMFNQTRPNAIIKQSNPILSYTFNPRAIYPSYFWGFDLGLKNDAAALAISHWENNGLDGSRKLVFDYIERRKAGEGKYITKAELDGDDLVEWLKTMSDIYPIADGIYDQWSGTLFGQSLHKKGVTRLRMENFTEYLNSAVYLSFRALSLNRELDLPTLNNKDLETEIQLLQCEMRPGNKIKVEAPPGDQYHDDMADAVARSTYVAMSFLNERGKGEAPAQQVTRFGTTTGEMHGMKNYAAIANIKRNAASDPRAAAKLASLKRSFRR